MYVLHFLFLFIVSDTTSAQEILPYTIALESSLRTDLFKDYDVLQKPAERVDVYITFSVVALNYMDIKSQTFSISGHFSLIWQDDRLMWLHNISLLSVRLLFSNSKYMWVPPIILENAIGDIVPLGSEKIFTKINPGGAVSWLPGGNYEANCEAEVTYYPLDTQTCTLTLSTMSYTMNNVRLIYYSDAPTDISGFTDNGEWDVMSITTTNSSVYLEGEPYSRIHYIFNLRRRPLYHILNTLFPVILMASLTIFVFKLPPESGERIGMSLTVLLAYAVYLTLISDDIPRTSKSVSLLSLYLTIILVLSALSVILTIFVLDVYSKPSDASVPDWLQSFTRGFLVRVTCWNVACTSKAKVAPKCVKASAESNNFNILREASEIDHFQRDKCSFESGIHDTKPQREANRMFNWKEIAQMLDKCFVYTYVLLFMIATTVCLGVLVSAYNISMF